MAFHLERKQNLNNLERNKVLAVKYVGADVKYVQDDYIDLGAVAVDALVTRVYAIVDEEFPAGTKILFGQLSTSGGVPVLVGWGTLTPILRGVYHVNVPNTENYEINTTPYAGETPAQFDNKMEFGAQLTEWNAENDVGSIRFVIEYAPATTKQTGGYIE